MNVGRSLRRWPQSRPYEHKGDAEQCDTREHTRTRPRMGPGVSSSFRAEVSRTGRAAGREPRRVVDTRCLPVFITDEAILIGLFLPIPR